MAGDTALLARIDRKPLVQLGLLRQVKDDDELRRLRRAIDITAEAEWPSWPRPGGWEYEIEALVGTHVPPPGCGAGRFPSIVGTGSTSTTLHYDKGRAGSRRGDWW